MGISILWSKTKDELLEIINNSQTIKEAVLKLGTKDIGCKRNTFFKVCDFYNIKLDDLRERSKLSSHKKAAETISKKLIKKEALAENSLISRKVIKALIIRENLLEYKCKKCGNDGSWEQEKLVLQLEHINGKNNDHRLENLCFLCPNCHSQTATFCGKSTQIFPSKEIKKKVKLINSKINEENNIKKFEESLKLIEHIDLTKNGWVEKVSKIWNISHTQVHRRFKKYAPDLSRRTRKSTNEKI